MRNSAGEKGIYQGVPDWRDGWGREDEGWAVEDGGGRGSANEVGERERDLEWGIVKESMHDHVVCMAGAGRDERTQRRD